MSSISIGLDYDTSSDVLTHPTPLGTGYHDFVPEAKVNGSGVVTYPPLVGESGIVDDTFPWGNVMRYGAVADWNGLTGTDNATAFNAAWAVVGANGGTLLVPPGQYYLNSQWLMTRSQPATILVSCYGAEIYSGTSVTGSAVKIASGFNEVNFTLQGLKGNHRNNTTVAAFIELNGAACVYIDDCTLEAHNTKSNYAAILISMGTPGNDDTGSFWSQVRRFSMRQRSGGDGTFAAYGVWLQGGHNAARVYDSEFGGCDVAIGLTTDGVSDTLANGVLISGNAFEGVTTAISAISTPTTGYYTAGLRICNNRSEAVTTFVSITTGGVAALEHSDPPFLYGNYCTNGTVTNWLYNPLHSNVNALEPAYYGPSTGIFLRSQSPVRFPAAGAQSNLILGNESGESNWSGQHLQFSETSVAPVHLWVDNSNGVLRIKGSAPTSASDGVNVANLGNFPMQFFGITLTPNNSKIVPGATSLSLRNHADSADNLLVTNAGAVAIRTRVTSASFVITYSSSMTPDSSLGNTGYITATNGSAFTINTPTNAISGQRLRIMIRNASGASLGAATWNSIFKMPAWTNPANEFNRTVEFEFNGTDWVEHFRSAVDVPN